MKSKAFDKILKSVTLFSISFTILMPIYGISNIVENKQIGSIFEAVNNAEAEMPFNENRMILSDDQDFKIETIGSNAFDDCLIDC